MLIARSPMRISFGGGGTDLEAYYAQYGGLVVSIAINKYFYAVISPDQSNNLQVISADYRLLFRHSPYNDLFSSGMGTLLSQKRFCIILVFAVVLTSLSPVKCHLEQAWDHPAQRRWRLPAQIHNG